MKRFISAIAALALIAGWATAARADGFTPTGYAPSSDTQAFVVQDMPDGPDSTSMLLNRNAPQPETEALPRFCRSLTTNGCSLDSTAHISGTSLLPYCAGQLESCVQSLTLTKPDGKVVEATMVKQFPGFSFPAVPQLNIPAGSTPSLWRAEGVLNSAGTDEYVVTVGENWRLENGTVRYEGMNARVTPVKSVQGPRYRPTEVNYPIQDATGQFQSNFDNGAQPNDPDCAATDYGYCAAKVDFASGVRAEITARVSNKVTGWLHGRIFKPDISVTPIDSNFNVLRVAGDPVTVPSLYATVKMSEMPDSFRTTYTGIQVDTGGNNSKSQWWMHSSSDNRTLDLVPLLSKAAKDTASETKTYWAIKSIVSTSTNDRCLSDTSRLVGLVTTNAMAYSGSAPSWDGTSLNYQVAGLHYMPDGKTLVEGTYDLAIRSDVARCLYGFSNAPISATVSVIDASGETKSAVTTVNEVDGWLKLAAYGFTFSSPSIKVQLSQKATAASPSVPTAQKTITCIKGKLTKKVTGVAPKCPTGFKKKA